MGRIEHLNWRTIKCDFHVHTRYSDNKEKLTIEDYFRLAKERNIDVVGIGDHHHNLTQRKWNQLIEDVECIRSQKKDNVIIIPGYEITFKNGHLVIVDKNYFDAETIKESFKQIHNHENIRVIAHPDNNSCKWNMNLLPNINGVEVINGGQDVYSYQENSACNGMRTYKKYLLMRQHIAPYAASDCHESIFFGRLWTGLLVQNNANITLKQIKNAIKGNHVYASFGNMEIGFFSDETVVMGDVMQFAPSKKIYWYVPDNAEVVLYYSDYALNRYIGEGLFIPTMNGPYWIYVRQGNRWAVSAPIWVEGIHENEEIIKRKKKMLLSNNLIRDLVIRVHQLVNSVERNSIDVSTNKNYLDINEYIKWIESFIPCNLDMQELVNKSIEMIIDENTRRLELCVNVLENLYEDILKERALLDETTESSDQTELLLYNTIKIDNLIKTSIFLPNDIRDFHLKDDKGREINFVYMESPYDKWAINEIRNGEKMKEVVIWINRGEMHEFKIVNLQMAENEIGILNVSFELCPIHMFNRDIKWIDDARRLNQYIKNNKYEQYHLEVSIFKEYILQIDSTEYKSKNKSPLNIQICCGEGNNIQNSLKVFDLFNNFNQCGSTFAIQKFNM